ncbi:hypothetical protein HG452_001080 [Candidatus Saccharibacteria bacterium]|nr:hypothetical protein [Candidatus Saccharibacteria bacterium]
MFKKLSQSIRGYAKEQSTDSMKRYYNDIADALDDEEFLQTLSNTEALGRLDYLRNDFNYYISSRGNYHDALNTIYINYATYRAGSKQTISEFSQKIRDFEAKIKESEESLEVVKNAAGNISGAEILEKYAIFFNEEAEEHKKKSRDWLIGLAISVAILIAIVASLLNIQIFNFSIIEGLLAGDIKKAAADNLKTLVFIIKGSIIIAYIQIPLFIRKNYFAEKHLEQSSIHRRNVLKALHAVYKTISNTEEKDKILTVGATIAFSEPESGFITRKEGAGGDDNIEAILKVIGK